MKERADRPGEEEQLVSDCSGKYVALGKKIF